MLWVVLEQAREQLVAAVDVVEAARADLGVVVHGLEDAGGWPASVVDAGVVVSHRSGLR